MTALAGRWPIAAALLLVGMAVLLAPPAQSQAQTEVWSASITTGSSDDSTIVGVWPDRSPPVGSITDRDFEYDGTTYTFTVIQVNSSGSLKIAMTTGFSQAAVDSLTFEAGNSSFALSDGTLSNSNSAVSWDSPGSSWSSGQTIAVKMVAQGATAGATPRSGHPKGADRDVLEALYDATDGDNWTKNRRWKTNNDPWYGVTANTAGKVSHVELTNNNLSGPMPLELGSLDEMTNLLLDGNALTGSIPSSLGDRANDIKYLELHDNQLTGSIPPELGNSNSLWFVRLHYNQLTGSIPAELGENNKLVDFHLNDNALSGSIPAGLSSLRKLTELNLQNNAGLSGAIPTDFAPAASTETPGLQDLRELHLQNTGVTVPSDTVFQNWINGIDLTTGSAESTSVLTLDAANTEPKGLWSDGTTLWVADSAADKVFAYVLPDLSRDDAKDIALVSQNGDARGLWSDGTTLWVADHVKDKVFAYTLVGGARDSAKELGLPGLIEPTAIWSDGTHMWVSTTNGRTVYAYLLSDGSYTSANNFDMTRSNDEGNAGMWSDGTTIWVVDEQDTRAYAYSLTNGNHKPDAYRIFDPTNAAPGWAWTEGSTTWVTDLRDGKVYVYTEVSTDATLRALTVNDGTDDLTLTPAFAPGTSLYAADVGNAVDAVTLTATVNDDGAAVSSVTLGGAAIADSDFTDGITVPSLVVGDNDIVVTVTAEDTSIALTYTVTVTRAVFVLVSNTGQNPSSSNFTVGTTGAFKYTQAQQFTTGDNDYGYVLSSVQVYIRQFGGSDAVRVSLYGTDASGNPDSSLHTLTNPAPIADDSFNTFTANASLASETNYVIVVEATAGSFQTKVTNSTLEDSGEASGWSINDVRHWRGADADAWVTTSASSPGNLRISLTGTIVPAPTKVPSDWSLLPTGLATGDEFRLIFLSSTTHNGSSSDIGAYNTFIQGLAAAGHTDIQSYSAGFRVVGCTANTDAVDNTATTGTGVPIYWLSGNQVADDYADFYDGSWADEANDKNASGGNGPDTSQDANYPMTGCDHDGTELMDGAASLGLGSSTGVVVAQPHNSGAGPLSGDIDVPRNNTRPMYGLSQVFEVAASTVATLDGLALMNAADDGTLELNEMFASTLMSYTADVGYGVMSITIEPETTNGAAMVTYLNDSDSALADADTNTAGFQVTLGPGANTIKVKVTAEDTSTVLTYTVVVTRETAAPTVTISADKMSAVFKEDGITYTLTRTGLTTVAVPVTVTLTQTKDFLLAADRTQTVTIPAGQAMETFTVAASSFQPFAAGTMVEGGTLTAAVQDGSDYDLGSPSSVDVSVVIGVTVRIDQASYSVSEAAGFLTVKAIARTRPGAPQPTLNVSAMYFDFTDGTAIEFTDYSSVDGNTVDVLPSNYSLQGDGVWQAEDTYGINVTDDDLDEDNESFTLTLKYTNLVNRVTPLVDTSGNACGSVCTVTVTITDDDTAGVTVSESSLTVAEEDTTGDTYTVVLNSQPTADVTITIGGQSGTDVTAAPSPMTFTAVNWAMAQTVTVTAGDDANLANETVSLTHAAESADSDYDSVTIADVTVTVEDNDTAQVMGLMIEPGNAQLVAQWTEVADATGYQLQWKTGGDSYTDSRRAVIGSGSTTSHTIPNLTNGTEYTVRVRATRSGANPGPYSAEVMKTPLVPTAAGVTVSKSALTLTEQDATGDTYTVVLDRLPTASVTVTVGGLGSSDLTANPASLTFTTVNWQTARTVTVTAGNDADTTNDSVTLTHSATSSDTDYHGIIISGLTVTVEDNDTAQVMGVMVEPGDGQLAVEWTGVGQRHGLRGAVEVGRPELQRQWPAGHDLVGLDHEPHDPQPHQRHRVHRAGESDAERRQPWRVFGGGDEDAGAADGGGRHGLGVGADGDGGGHDRRHIHSGPRSPADGGCHDHHRRAVWHGCHRGSESNDLHGRELADGPDGDGDGRKRCGPHERFRDADTRGGERGQ